MALNDDAQNLDEELDARRAWVWSSVNSDGEMDRSDVRTTLSVVAALNAAVESTETWKLQSLGIVFGDALAAFLESPWIQINDEYGRDAAVQFGEPDELLFPMTMISKRREAGEDVDVMQLFTVITHSVLDRRTSG